MQGAAVNLDPATSRRYHGLDGLRAFAMLLGVLLHATLPYFSRRAGLEFMWPADNDQSLSLLLLFDYIHLWRMPTFFLLAGFFAHLMLERRSTSAFVRDRLRRIAVPLVLFGAVMAVVVPALWRYGWQGEFVVDLSLFHPRTWPDLAASGTPMAHLWFLWYLLLMYGSLLVFRFLGTTRIGVALRSVSGGPALGRRIGGCIYSRAPLVLVVAAAVLLAVRGGDESKPIWPPNVPDLLYGLIFFWYGYGLWARRWLLEGLQGRRALAGLWGAGMLAYGVHVIAMGALDQGQAGAVMAVTVILNTLAYGSAAALLSLALVGSFEAIFRTPRRWVRWMADSSYWIYLMHLPLVSLLTFWLAHLDAAGRLTSLTGFNWGAELKFSLAFVATSAVGMVTYRYLVRYTPLGTLLNGKRDRSPPQVPS